VKPVKSGAGPFHDYARSVQGFGLHNRNGGNILSSPIRKGTHSQSETADGLTDFYLASYLKIISE
jgi:hypothetical protein